MLKMLSRLSIEDEDSIINNNTLSTHKDFINEINNSLMDGE